MARKWLKELRKAKRLTQVDIAERLGISQNHYCNIENGLKQKDLPLSMARKISEVLDVPLEYIVDFEFRRG